MPTDWSVPYWSGVEQGEIRLPWCTVCDAPHFPPRPFCPDCWCDDIKWRPASGKGTLYSYTVVHSNPPSGFDSLLPFAIGIVHLDEGVQMLSNVIGDLQSLACDMPVEVKFRDVGERKLPYFEPRRSA